MKGSSRQRQSALMHRMGFKRVGPCVNPWWTEWRIGDGNDQAFSVLMPDKVMSLREMIRRILLANTRYTKG